MSLNELESLEPKSLQISEGIFKTPREIKKDTAVRMRLLLPEHMGQPFFLTKLHYWGWNSPVKTTGACPRVIGQKCPACDLWSRLINHKELADKDSPARKALMNLSADDKAYVNIVVLDEESGEPVDGEPLVYSMGANKSNGPNQSAFHKIKASLLSFGKMYKGQKPWGNTGHDLLITYTPFREYSSISQVGVYPDSGVELAIDSSDMFDLEAFAHSEQLTEKVVAGLLDDVLGEFAHHIFGLDNSRSKSKDTPKEAPKFDGEEV